MSRLVASTALCIFLCCGFVAGQTTTWSYRLVNSAGVSTGVLSGRLEVRPSTSTTWGTVCDDLFGGADATVACRSLGLGTTSPTYSTATSSMWGTSSQPTYMDDLGCTGSEARLDLCSYVGSSSEDCGHSEDIVLTCQAASATTTLAPGATTAAPVTTGATPSTSSSWSYRLVSSSGAVAGSVGRLEVRPSSSSTWGTVCDDAFASTDASVACRSLGFTSFTATYATASAELRGSGSQPIYMDDMGCTGSESSLDRCSYTGSILQNCDHVEDIVVGCGSTSASSLVLGSPSAPSGPASSAEVSTDVDGGQVFAIIFAIFCIVCTVALVIGVIVRDRNRAMAEATYPVAAHAGPNPF